MGNSECKFTEKFDKRYDFIQYVKDPDLGPIKIYRKKQPFYDYLMICERLVNEEDMTKHEKQLKAINKLQKGEEESLLLKIYHKEHTNETITNCTQKQRIRLYVQYYNYTLRQLIDYKNQNKTKFSLDEIMYIITSVIKVYQFYQEIDVWNVQFRTEEIYVSTDGELRFCPVKIFPKIQETDTQCVDVGCLAMTKLKKTFRINQKLIVYEIKKILSELTQICNPTLTQDKQIFILKSNVNSCSTIKQIEKLLYHPQVDHIDFGSKKSQQQKSEEQTTKICKNSPAVSQYSQSSKISVKNFALHNRQRKDHRPLSYQQYYP